MVMLLSIFGTFIWPLIKKLFLSLRDFKAVVTPGPDTTQEEKVASKKLKKQTWQVAAVVLFLLAIGLGFFIYFQSRPETILAKNFVRREAGNLAYIEENEAYSIILNSDLYLIDLRSERHFEDRHIKGSFNIQPDRLEKGVTLPEDRKVAVYSSFGDVETAKSAGETINKEIKAKVYIIEDGYEGLKNQGLNTETGKSFGGEYFSF